MLENISVQTFIIAATTLIGFIGLVIKIVKPIVKTKEIVENHEKRLNEIEASSSLVLRGIYAILSQEDKNIEQAREELKDFLLKRRG